MLALFGRGCSLRFRVSDSMMRKGRNFDNLGPQHGPFLGVLNKVYRVHVYV